MGKGEKYVEKGERGEGGDQMSILFSSVTVVCFDDWINVRVISVENIFS